MMKTRFLYLSFSFILCFTLQAQAQWSTHRLSHDGVNRKYMLYLPQNYNPSTPASLILTLHGLGEIVENFSQRGFDQVADTTNYIVVAPQAMDDILTGPAWNSRAGLFGYYPNTGVDDIGFLNELVDTVIANYSINQNQVYICGMSMGGFMTQRMACESNEKFKAFASVAGTRGSGIYNCDPGRPIPMAHFHGTEDATIGYYDNNFGWSVDDLISYWVQHNDTDPNPVETRLPDLIDDGYTVDYFYYPNDPVELELFRVNNADHVWLYKDENDISYAEEIIKFFNKTHEPLQIEDSISSYGIKVYPNPAKDKLYVDLPSSKASDSFDIRMFDLIGKLIFETQTNEKITRISLDTLSVGRGIYILEISNSEIRFTQKVVVE